MAERLQFKRNRKVYWYDTLVGEIVPELTINNGKCWGYRPEASWVPDVPQALCQPLYYYLTQRQIKSSLKRKLKGIVLYN